jgi:general secretion pathway protein L
MARVVGIDLGSHSVKVSVLEGSFGRFEHKGYYVRAVAQDADGAPDLAKKLEALADLKDEIGGKADVVTTAFPADAASVRVVELPFADARQVEKTVPFEVEAIVPFELDDMILASRILSLATGSSKVLVGLAERQAMGALLDGLHGLGLDPRNVMLDAEVLERLGSDRVQAIVDMGHTRTIVTLTRDGKVVATRAFLGGGRDVTLALSRQLGISYTEAEARKHRVGIVRTGPDLPTAAVEWEDEEVTAARPVSPVDPTSLPEGDDILVSDDLLTSPEITNPRGPEVEVVREALTPILGELRSTLISLEDQAQVDIGEIVLVGGTAALAGLREWMQLALGVPVRRVAVTDDPPPGVPAESLALAKLLGERASSTRTVKLLEFRKGDLVYRGDITAMRNIAAYGAVAALAFIVVGVGLFAYRHVQLSRNLAALDEQLRTAIVETYPGIDESRLKDATTAKAIAQELTLASVAKVDALKALHTTEPPTLALLREVSEAVPPGDEVRIDVTEMTISEGSITFDAETDSFNTATKIENTLREHPRFRDARKGEERKCKDDICFKMTIPLGEAVAAGTPVEGGAATEPAPPGTSEPGEEG